MADPVKFALLPIRDLLPADVAALWKRALEADTGLSIVSGHFRSGKSTIAVSAAQAAEEYGRSVTVVADSSDYFLRNLLVPPSWRIVAAGESPADWKRALDNIDDRANGIVLVSSLSLENAEAVLDAAKRLCIIACVDTPLVGVDVIYSLTQLGLEQAAITATLNCIHSQCLVRALCHSCREPVSLGRRAVQDIAPGARGAMDVWSEVGCPDCSGTGTKGWIAVFEIMVIDGTTRDALTEAARLYVAPVLPATHYRSIQEVTRGLLLKGDVGLATFRREISDNPVLRATNQLERERDAARTTRDLFRRFVDAAVIETIVADDGMPLVARRADATCLFCDIRGFTSFSEQHEPQQVFRILNRLVDEIIALVIRHGGMVDKLIGDSVMALFGLPVAKPDHAVRAASCAIAIQQRIARLGVENPEVSGLRAGIGVNSGELAVGCLGNAQRMEYTVLGDVVNTAARLESIAQPGQVLVGRSTRHRLGNAFVTRDLGEMSLRGKAESVQVFELVSSAKDIA